MKNELHTGYATLAVGITPESSSMARRDMAAYIQKNMTISFLPTAVYLLRMCKIIMAVMMMATMCTKHVAVGWLGCIHRSFMKNKTDKVGI